LAFQIFLLSLHPKSNFKDMGQKEDIVKTENKIIAIRDKQVILDRDVAELYGVETKRINEALKNNPDKFPNGYVITLNIKEKDELVENFDRFKTLKHSTVEPHAFTEKGLYMLATILKSPLATEVTIAIIETFSKVREVSRAIAKVNDDAEKGIMPKEEEQGKIQNLMGEVLADNLPLKMRKMAFSLNLGFLKVSVETTRGKD
jgi:predicted Ser/Thr protein kinase